MAARTQKTTTNDQMAVSAQTIGWCREREKIDWQKPSKFDCRLVRTILFFVVLRQFSQVVGEKLIDGEWLENQILIPDWAYFYCSGATLLKQ